MTRRRRGDNITRQRDKARSLVQRFAKIAGNLEAIESDLKRINAREVLSLLRGLDDRDQDQTLLDLEEAIDAASISVNAVARAWSALNKFF